MIKFYVQYVDNTLLLVKPADIPHIHNLFNKYDKNLRFTVDRFENEVPHFLYIKTSPLGLPIYQKNTNTLILKGTLLGITKSAGFEVLLQERNRYTVQIYCQQKFTI